MESMVASSGNPREVIGMDTGEVLLTAEVAKPDAAAAQPCRVRRVKKKSEEGAAKLLDDLFRKTKTTPCIYWLPLSPEQGSPLH
ncbi:hypothetical protein B566_EDAN002395 [Ephemera danica]|nr:hypothetical protein B566_EDAN002395 [Ephemera danica]